MDIMEEATNLLFEFDLSAEEVMQKLSDLGNGCVLDGVHNVIWSASEGSWNAGYNWGLKQQLMEDVEVMREAIEDLNNRHAWQKVVFAGGGVLVGVGGTVLLGRLIKKNREKKAKKALAEGSISAASVDCATQECA